MNDATPSPAVLDVWMDLQCPDCHRAQQDIRALRERFGATLEIRLRHFPLPRHGQALAAAQAAEEAFAQGRGEEYTEALLARTERLATDGETVLIDLARELGLDASEMETALIDGRHLLAVDADQAEGAALGVTGTPTYLIGGRRLDGGASQEGLRTRITALADELLSTTA